MMIKIQHLVTLITVFTGAVLKFLRQVMEGIHISGIGISHLEEVCDPFRTAINMDLVTG
ncbi:hypothetical protein D9M70_639160 [compost metagenome]